ncbi:unnamed protein product [Penicillium salamii]|nr:unnamed protein product [Penicillium salamii]
MRLRSNAVLDPLAQRQTSRRRRGTRASSAQESEPEATVPGPSSTPATPEGRPAKKAKAQKASPKKDKSVPTPFASLCASPFASLCASPFDSICASLKDCSIASPTKALQTAREERYARRRLRRGSVSPPPASRPSELAPSASPSPVMDLDLSPATEVPSSPRVPQSPDPRDSPGSSAVHSPFTAESPLPFMSTGDEVPSYLLSPTVQDMSSPQAMASPMAMSSPQAMASPMVMSSPQAMASPMVMSSPMAMPSQMDMSSPHTPESPSGSPGSSAVHPPFGFESPTPLMRRGRLVFPSILSPILEVPSSSSASESPMSSPSDSPGSSAVHPPFGFESPTPLMRRGRLVFPSILSPILEVPSSSPASESPSVSAVLSAWMLPCTLGSPTRSISMLGSPIPSLLSSPTPFNRFRSPIAEVASSSDVSETSSISMESSAVNSPFESPTLSARPGFSDAARVLFPMAEAMSALEIVSQRSTPDMVPPESDIFYTPATVPPALEAAVTPAESEPAEDSSSTGSDSPAVAAKLPKPLAPTLHHPDETPADTVIFSPENPLKPHGENPHIDEPLGGPSAQPTSIRTLLKPTRRQPTRGPLRMKAFHYGSATERLSSDRLADPNGKKLTNAPDESRKRSRVDEQDTPMKRHKHTRPTTRHGSMIRTRPRTTYADRTRRRQAEVGGRIHSTIYRVPEYLAQQRADARSAPPSNTEPNDQDTTSPGGAHPTENPIPPPEAPTPSEAPNTPGWGRWMVDGVSRRLTGLVGRPSSPQVANAPHSLATELVQQPVQNEAGRDRADENVNHGGVPTSPPATSPTRDSSTSASRAIVASNPNSPVAGTAGSRNRYGNYDLFGAGFTAEQRARWYINAAPVSLAPVSTAPDSATPDSAAPDSAPAQSPPQQTPTHEAQVSTKRKRQPTPDVIPNPPGCSYGLNDEYFIYSDEDWDAQEANDAKSTPSKEQGTSKKARIESSPKSNHQGQLETPDQSSSPEKRASKRARVERPPNFNYSGHFEVPYSSSEASGSTQSSPLPTAGPPSSPAKRGSRRWRGERPPNFNYSGHFEVPYSSSDATSSPRRTPQSSPATNPSRPQTYDGSYDGSSDALSPDDHQQGPRVILTPRKNSARKRVSPRQDILKTSPVDIELLKRARDQAEQYKPKTPSRLRAAHRFSGGSSLGGGSNRGSLFGREGHRDNKEDAIRRRRLMRKSSLAKACPSGNLNNILWPEHDTWANRLRGFIDKGVVSRAQRRHPGFFRPPKQGAVDACFEEAINQKRADRGRATPGRRTKLSSFDKLWSLKK